MVIQDKSEALLGAGFHWDNMLFIGIGKRKIEVD